MTFGALTLCRSIFVAAIVWLGVVVSCQQPAQASCGDYLLMEDHAQATARLVDPNDFDLQRALHWLTKPAKRCSGPGCQQTPAESLQGIPVANHQRLTDLPLAITETITVMQSEHESDLCLLAKRIILSSGFPESVFRPPVNGV